jgi:hypothetical protein
MQIIQNWLNSKQNFTVGRLLYEQFGTDKGFKNLLKQNGDSPFNRKKLREDLTAIANGTQKKAISGLSKQMVTKEMPEGNSPLLQALNKEWKPLYMRMNFLRHQLQSFGSDNSKETVAKADPMCLEILELEQQCMKIWAKRDHVLEHGRLPEVKAAVSDIPTDPVALGRYVENCKRQIRRNRTKIIEKPTDPKYAQLLADWKEKYLKATGNEYQEKNSN